MTSCEVEWATGVVLQQGKQSAPPAPALPALFLPASQPALLAGLLARTESDQVWLTMGAKRT